MNQNKIFCVFLVLTTITITSCGGVTPVASTIPVETKAAYSTVVSDIRPVQTLPAGQYGVVKLSLEITRNAKIYDVILGYDIGNAWWHQNSNVPDLPQVYSEKPSVSDAKIQWIGDIDKDGNLEYIVEFLFCGAYCSSQVQIIHYDSVKDEYRSFDSFNGYFIKNYQDIDEDANPEIISQDYDYHFKIGGAGATRALAPIKIYHYNNEMQEFIVVTSQYPSLVKKDAESFLTSIKNNHQQSDSGLLLAGYLYDMSILGKQYEGISTFKEICNQYLQPKTLNPDWSCDNYLSKVVSVLEEMKIGSK